MSNQSKKNPWRVKVTRHHGSGFTRSVKWGRRPHWSTREHRERLVLQKPRRFTWNGDAGTQAMHIKVSRDFLKGAGRERRLLLTDELLHMGIIRSSQCSCSHCQADFDCCGRVIGGPVKVTRLKGRTFLVEQSLFRNV